MKKKLNLVSPASADSSTKFDLEEQDISRALTLFITYQVKIVAPARVLAVVRNNFCFLRARHLSHTENIRDVFILYINTIDSSSKNKRPSRFPSGIFVRYVLLLAKI